MASLNIINNKNDEEIAEQIASVINEQLKLGKKVLWFLTGGSSTPMQILISQKIVKAPESELVITLTDERYGEVNHSDSNWFKLMAGGFFVAEAKLISILSGKNIFETTKDFIKKLEPELNKADYKIGLFGIGADGHTCGVLPHSPAVSSQELVYSYDAPPFERITITPKTILKLDQAFVYAMGETKWPAIKKLQEEISLDGQPAQILKKVPLLTIFTDK